MNATVIFDNANVRSVLNDFYKCFGGNVGFRGSSVAYLHSDKKTVYIQPLEETEEEFLDMLQESIKSGKNLIPEHWKLHTLPGSGILE